MGTLYLVTTICSVWLSGGTEECHSLEPFGAICALVTEENLECSPSFGISPTIKETAGVNMSARWVNYSVLGEQQPGGKVRCEIRDQVLTCTTN